MPYIYSRQISGIYVIAIAYILRVLMLDALNESTGRFHISKMILDIWDESNGKYLPLSSKRIRIRLSISFSQKDIAHSIAAI